MSLEETADIYYWQAHDLQDSERVAEAVGYLEAALEIEPRHLMSLVLLGDIHSFDFELLGITEDAANVTALDYYERALALEPKHAEAWSGKALVLQYMERFEEALDAAEAGLLVLPLCIGYAMQYEPVHVNVAESLFDVKVKALLSLCMLSEARQGLSDGLTYCPGSDYLSRHIPDVSPLALDLGADTEGGGGTA